MIVLSGDIGGTSIRLQLTEFGSNDEFTILKTIRYKNANYSSFNDVIDAFMLEIGGYRQVIESACFGVAGPIVNGVVQFTNLPWLIRVADIKAKLSLEKVKLINDFEAVGYGIEMLLPTDLETLQKGKARDNGVRAFIGAGTGLGVGFMAYDERGKYFVYPTEGGHVDFAPTDDLQVELFKYLRKKYHRVSFERVLSGQGLVNIYHFVRDNKIFSEDENPSLRFLLEGSKDLDVAATIAEYAIKHKDIMSMRALDMFIRIYGAAVGNLALSTLPYGGIYIVGGIAPKLLMQIKSGVFMEMYDDKGRMSHLLKDIPVHIVMNTDVGLCGAAVFARRILEV